VSSLFRKFKNGCNTTIVVLVPITEILYDHSVRIRIKIYLERDRSMLELLTCNRVDCYKRLPGISTFLSQQTDIKVNKNIFFNRNNIHLINKSTTGQYIIKIIGIIDDGRRNVNRRNVIFNYFSFFNYCFVL